MTQLEILERDVKEAEEVFRKQQEKLKEAQYLAKQAELEPLKDLVIKAHSVLCRWNHMDGCGWMYEMGGQNGKEHNWNSYDHKKWLEHYGRILQPDQNYSKDKPVSVETIDKFLDLAAELKKVDPAALWIIRSKLEP